MDIQQTITAITAITTFGWTAYSYLDTRKREEDLKDKWSKILANTKDYLKN